MNPVLQIRPFSVVEIRWETLDVFTLILCPEQPEQMVAFLPGQWTYLHFLKPDGTSEGRAAYSIASAPEESQEQLEFGIKVYGLFTKRLSKVMPGDILGVQGPFGVFTLRSERVPQVYFAAGIGITPFRCMIRSLWLRKEAVPIHLIYSNKSIESLAYFNELQHIAEVWPSFHTTFTLTQELPRVWPGEQGRIHGDMLVRHLGDEVQGDYLACGSQDFMQVVRMLLEQRGVDVRKQFRIESFG